MAFSYTGGVVGQGNASTASVTHGLTINSGDLVVAFVSRNGTATISADSGGATFTEAINTTVSGQTARVAFYWKVANGSEPSAYGFTFGASDQYQIHIRVFTAAATPIADSAANFAVNASSSENQSCTAIDGAVISDNAVSVIFGSKDTRSGSDTYTTADNSYTGVLGSTANQDTASAYRIYTTGTTFSGTVEITDPGASPSDRTYSVHMSFVEDSGGLTITPNGIASAETIGSHTISTGAVSISPAGISSTEAFGSSVLTAIYQVTPSSISSAESFGSPVLTTGAVSISPDGIVSSEAFGAVTVSTNAVLILPSSISSGEQFGSATITTGAVAIIPTGISSAEAFGAASLVSGAIILPSSIETLESFGSPALSPGVVYILPTGIGSGEAFGIAQVGDIIVAGDYGIVQDIVKNLVSNIVQ